MVDFGKGLSLKQTSPWLKDDGARIDRILLLTVRLAPPGIPLRTICVDGGTGDQNEGWCWLSDWDSGHTAGEAAHCASYSAKDSVASYLVAWLTGDEVFEAVELASQPGKYLFYHRGHLFGHMVGNSLRMSRYWRLFLGEARVGEVKVDYPIGNGSRLSIVLQDSTSLPFTVGTVWGSGESHLVLAPDTPQHGNQDLERLHFVAALVFRRLLLGVDYCSG
ncbi:MAG: hypothetical protein U1E05_01430 [Patescibacteria group bacterium]|nr:hypothetical protein [Patescibacteria group bacterium]